MSDCGIDAMKMAKNKDHRGGCGKDVKEASKKEKLRRHYREKQKNNNTRAYSIEPALMEVGVCCVGE